MIALQRGLALTLPLVMVGALASLLRYPPIPGLLRLYSPEFIDFCDHVIDGTFGIAELVAMVGFSMSFTNLHIQKYGQRFAHPAITSVVVMSCFFIFISPTDETSLRSALSINNGLLTGLLITMIGSSLVLKLSRIRWLRLPLGALGSDPLVGDVFQVMPAAMITILLFVIGKALLIFIVPAGFGETLTSLLSAALAHAEDGISFALAYEFLSQVLWFFGLHGPNILHIVHDTMQYPASLANALAAAEGTEVPYIFTAQFFDFFARIGGSGSTICLICALLLSGSSLNSRRLALLALIPAIFNVNEPLLFGIPLVLNPVYAIPFIFTPLVEVVVTYGAMSLELMPKTSVNTITWTTPVFISGYLVTGSLTGVVVQALNLAIGTALYIPFVRLSERITRQRSDGLLKSLLKAEDNRQSTQNTSRYLERHGPEGRMAIALAHDLEEALTKSGSLFAEYQPQIDVRNWQVSGSEALLRWNHPLYGRIAPPLIVSLAEEIGCLDQLGLHVLKLACRQRKQWENWLPDDFVMSVNVSPYQLRASDFTGNVLKVIREQGLLPGHIELEILETTALLPHKASIQALIDLRKAGVRIALDDFGMGHTSIHYIRELPLDTIKIDRSLTQSSQNNTNELIVKSILELGQTLEISIVVEGVEEEEQVDRFAALGCDVFQGFFFSKPIPAQAFPSFAQTLMNGRYYQSPKQAAFPD